MDSLIEVSRSRISRFSNYNTINLIKIDRLGNRISGTRRERKKDREKVKRLNAEIIRLTRSKDKSGKVGTNNNIIVNWRKSES